MRFLTLLSGIILIMIFTGSGGWADDIHSSGLEAPPPPLESMPRPTPQVTPQPTAMPASFPTSQPPAAIDSNHSPNTASVEIMDVNLGCRISASLAEFNLTDLNTNQLALAYKFQQDSNSQPTYDYQTRTTSVSNAAVFEIGPFLRINRDLDAGFAFDYWAFTPLDFDVNDIHPAYFHDYQRNLNSVEFKASLRFYAIQSADRKFRFFLEPGGGLQPINCQLIENYQNTSNNPSTDQVGDNVNCTAVDLGLKSGVAMDLGWGLFSLGVGYQYDYAQGFTGVWDDAQVPALNGVPGSLVVYRGSNSGVNTLLFIPNGVANQALFGITPYELANSRALVIDLSGFRLSADYSLTF